MPPIELGPTRPIGAIDVRIARQSNSRGDRAQRAEAEPSAIALSDALDPGEAPVDADRVAEIRKAIENGSYPIVPTKIADAIIAAGILLRSGE
ncbi:MAG: flagellar biosynthesis anti-sigma factor FlgM [Novosphingobium sp.]|nr:flagellar biosynthesis anti-sigma factor FlgM [Novosphingobium sp.]